MVLRVLILLPLCVIGQMQVDKRKFRITNTGWVKNTLGDMMELWNSPSDPGMKLDRDGDWNQPISALATKNGYQLQEHGVVTADGYILKLHRLLNPNATSNARVVFLMHGIQDSADSWLLQGRGNALAYILADNGYDVWMGNARGNIHSNKHKLWTTKDIEYWNFSWEQIGTYDLPAMIDTALAVANQNELYYVGYSQGTTAFYVMTSLRPRYNARIKMMFSLAPVAWLKHVKSPMITLFPTVYRALEKILWNFNAAAPSTLFLNRIMTIMCIMSKQSCEGMLYLMNGDEHLFDPYFLPMISSRVPSGSSIKQFVHYGQLAESGRFCRFDYDTERNLEMYNNTVPPDYDLSKVTTPVVLFYSDKDWLSTSIDVNMLASKLPYVYGKYFVPGFSHLDFLYAYEAKDGIYATIMDMIDYNYYQTGRKKMIEKDQIVLQKTQF